MRFCRVYAPVGGHEDLLAYLVRRLLETGANTSFVNRLVDEQAPITELIADPVARLAALPAKPHPRIPLPRDLYGPARANAGGIDLSDRLRLGKLAAAMDGAAAQSWWAGPIIGGSERLAGARPVRDPSDHRREIGTVAEASAEDAEAALAQAAIAATTWDAVPAEERARILERAAGLLEARRAPFMTMIVREGGR